MLLAAAILSADTPSVRAGEGGDERKERERAEVVCPGDRYHGHTYAEWSAAALQWSMELPLAGHPATDTAGFDVSAGQSGDVWFLVAPFGTVQRTGTIPRGTALFITLANVEVSSLESPPFHGATEAEQRTLARFIADHIVPTSLVCKIDGVSVKHLERYRFSSPQFDFTAPSPWIFGDIGGSGTSVGDGYYVMLEPLSRGQHTIHFEGLIHFDAGEIPEFGSDPLDLSIDTTYQFKVE